jgi:hypothetical protein
MILRGDICSFPGPATGAHSCVDPINNGESFWMGMIPFSLLFKGLGRWTISGDIEAGKNPGDPGEGVAS